MRRGSCPFILAFVVVAAGFVGACGSTEAADPCETQLSELETRLGSAAARAEPSGAPPGVPLPSSEAGVALEGAPPLLVVSSEVVFAGRGVGGVGDAEAIDHTAETLRNDLRSWSQVHDVSSDAPFPIALWVAPDVRVDDLVRLLRHAPSNARFALLIRGPVQAAREDEPSWVGPALRSRSGRPESQRRHLEAAWTRAVESCSAAAPHMPTPAPLAPAGPPLGAPAIGGLMGALRSCGCESTELAAIEAVATHALINADGPVLRAAATLRFGPPTDGSPAIEVAPDLQVHTLVERLSGREGALWIAAP